MGGNTFRLDAMKITGTIPENTEEEMAAARRQIARHVPEADRAHVADLLGIS